MSFDGFVIVTVRRNDYRIIFWFISKNKAVSKMNSANLSEKSEQL